MKHNWWRACVIIAACVVALSFAAEEPTAKNDEAEYAWQAVMKGTRPPPPPAEWKDNEPSRKEVAAWEKKNGLLAAEAADKARDFYNKFPSHARAKDARMLELKLLSVSVQLGNTNRAADLARLEEKRLNDPTLPAEEKFDLRAQRVAKLIMDEDSKDRAGNLTKAERLLRDLQEDFPKREEGFELALMLAQELLGVDQAAKARALTEDAAKNAKGELQEQAQAQLRKLDRIGKPLDLHFKDLDGKPTGISQLAGKVVLVDFWATWCGPCRATMPEVKETYAKFQKQGFEILGISLDKDKEALTKVLAEEKIPWPQHFDGLGWESKMAKSFEITSIPTVWLVDKKGVLRDLNGRQDLAAKVEKLLSEK